MAKKMRGFADGGDTSTEEETFPVASNPEQEKKSSEFLKGARRSNDDGSDGSTTPIPPPPRPDRDPPFKNSQRVMTSESESAAGEEVGRRLRGGDYYVEPGSYEKRSVESDRMDKMQREKMVAAKKRSVADAKRATMEGATPRVGYKKGGMVSKKSGGSVRGAGIAQRGQGKMRMC
jgi:hypothetical protein